MPSALKQTVGQNENLYIQISMLPIAQVTNMNTLRWFGHVIRRDEKTTPRVVMKLKMKGHIPRGRPGLRWLDNIDSHLLERTHN